MVLKILGPIYGFLLYISVHIYSIRPSMLFAKYAIRLWVNGNGMFYETFIERNDKEISAYLRDKQIEVAHSTLSNIL